MNIKGNYTALVTPFKKNGSIDEATLETLINFQLKHQTDGIVALGSTAEAPNLNSYEKHKIMELITSTVQGKIPIIAGVNGFSTKDVLLQCRCRFADGANALLITPPPYIKPTQKEILNYYLTLADNSYIPIILYNVPSRTGSSISIENIKALAKHENIIGIKEASGDVEFAQKIALETFNEDFTLIVGNDNLLIPLLSIGTKAIISVVGNIMPELPHDIIELYNSGCIEDAKRIYFKHLPLINSLGLESNPIPIKYMMSRLDMLKPVWRAPLDAPSNKNKAKLNKIIQQYLFK